MSDYRSAWSRPSQKSEQRPTVGTRTTQDGGGSAQAEKRKIGRPSGSKNKAKYLVPKELASEFLGVVKEILPPEHYQEMKRAVENGERISTLSEARITLKLMGPAIWQRLIAEGKTKPVNIDADMVEEVGESPTRTTSFSRDLNERLKVYMTLMQFIDGIEKRYDEEADSRKKSHIEILTGRGISADRIRVLVGAEFSTVGGDSDGTRRPTIEVGTFSDQVPERQEHIQDSMQGSAIGLLDNLIDRDDSHGEHPQEPQ